MDLKDGTQEIISDIDQSRTVLQNEIKVSNQLISQSIDSKHLLIVNLINELSLKVAILTDVQKSLARQFDLDLDSLRKELEEIKKLLDK